MLTRVIGVLCVAVGGVLWYVERPSTALTLPVPSGTTSLVRGAIHVHTARSDGSGDPASIAAAAARAGLAFVILTDHGDATRRPDAPRYLAGVLCIDAVEISTTQGHVLALGLPQAPYPLGGEARDVVEDITRLGGFTVAAHPDSSKADLQWSDRTVPIDGLEWLNADSEWRNESGRSLVRALMMYPVYRAAALTTLLDRPASTLQRWDTLTLERRVVAIAASDAHARVGLRNIGEPYTSNSLHLPSYEDTFRMFSNVLPSVVFSGDATRDEAMVLAAIRLGRIYSVVDGLAAPAALSFTATSGATTVSFGDALPIGGPVTLRISTQGPDNAVITLRKDGVVLDTRSGRSIERIVDGAAAVYRVEVSLPDAPGVPPVPWIVSNPIYVGRAEPTTVSPTPVRRRPFAVSVQYRDGPVSGWTVEHSAASLGVLEEVASIPGRQLSLRYALGGTAAVGAFTAFVMPAATNLPNYDRLIFTGRSNQPMRVSVQVRGRDGSAGQRWHRSVYLEQTAREVSVAFNDMLPLGVTSNPRPRPADIESVLFVLDTVNTALGGNGTLWLDNVRYEQ